MTLLFWKLLGSRVLGFLKGVSWKVWLGIAVAVALFFGVRWHGNRIEASAKANYAKGYGDAMIKVTARAQALERKATAAEKRINAEIRSKTDEENRRTAAVADDLRLRGAGKARCYSPAVPSGPGGHLASGGGANASATGLPEPDRIAVPFDYLVNQAERADLNRNEVLAWREWHQRFTKEWAALSAKR